MPSLGFLKKKRTKDSSSKDFDSPTSPVKDTSSPITPTLTKSSDPSTAAELTPQTSVSTAETSKAADSMNSSAYQQQPFAQQTQPQGQYQQSQNVPSISNLIHHTPADSVHGGNAGQPAAQKSTMAANGGAVAGTPTLNLPSQQPTQPQQVRTTKGKYTLPDFTIQRTLGTGSFGRVHLVQSKHNSRFYAIKVLKKAQVVKMKQVEHTNDERRMLQQVKHPFLITLWGTFQDSKNLYMVMDFVEGGELFSLLRKSQVCRAKHPQNALLLTRCSASRIPSRSSTLPK